MRIIQALGTGHASQSRFAFIQLDPHAAADIPLRHIDKRIQRLAKLAEPLPVIHHLGILQCYLLLIVSRFPIQTQHFQRLMGRRQDRSAGRLIDPAGLHPNQAILHQIRHADTMHAADSIERLNQLDAVGLLAVQFHRDTLLKADFDILSLVWGLRDGPAQNQHLILRLIGRVFQVRTLVADMPEVPVAGINLLHRLLNRDFPLFGIFDRRFPAGQCKIRVFPRGNNLQIRRQRHERQLKPHLVVTLAGSAMRYRRCPGLPGHIHLMLGNQRPGNAGTQQVPVFIHRAAFEHRPDVIFHKFLAEVLDYALDRTGRQGLLLNPRQFVTLSQFGGKRHHFIPVCFLQPRQDHARIQPAAVSQYHFFSLILNSHHYFLSKYRHKS